MKRPFLLPVLVLLAAPVTAAPQPSLNAYFQSTLKDTAYQKKVFDKVAAAWKMPSSRPKVGKKTVVQSVIAKDGKLVSAMVSMQSGSKAWDDAALRAVKTAAPFDPLPAGYGYPTLEVHFHVAWVEPK